MQNTEKSVSTEVGGRSWKFSTGRLATQSNGAVVIRVGDTMVMANVVMGEHPREGVDYLPLMVDYEEKLYAAGKIKGSRWVKREGRPSDEAILSGRVTDRSLRPMFDGNIRHDIQVIVTTLSVDGENDPDIVGLNAASAAIAVSDIPWLGPIAGVRVGKINGEFVLNPSFEQVENESTLDLIVSGTSEHIIMVEAGAKEVPEEEILEAIDFAHQEIKKLAGAIDSLAKEAGKPKRELEIFKVDDSVKTAVEAYRGELESAIYSADRVERKKQTVLVEDKIMAEVQAAESDGRASTPSGTQPDKLDRKLHVKAALETLTKKIIQGNILDNERRIDGRKLDEIRTIGCEAGLLPRVHGSGLFERGETQVLTTLTMGGPGDVQLLEDIDTTEERKKRYMHHYNFPGFSVGEVKPLRSPGRREIGHGALAERALEPVLPPKDDFPYTLRLVSEVLSSNGSTSMASTCGSTLALMDAGIAIKSPVSGIAMGLILDEQTGKFKVLSDILGTEDGNGHMDFKVAGTRDGITALQLDIKVRGLTLEILKDALGQAKDGRMFILEKMIATIPEPRAELSRYAPRIISFRINPEKIREVIGPGGKTINAIIADTGVQIDIEDDGLVMITASNGGEGSKKAREWIENLTREVVAGEEFSGKITRILDFGAFTEILPGQEGLIHISELAPYHVAKVSDEVKVGDIVKVKVKNIDELGRINLSRKALMPARQSPDGSRRPAGGPKSESGDFDKHRGQQEDDRGKRRFIAKR